MEGKTSQPEEMVHKGDRPGIQVIAEKGLDTNKEVGSREFDRRRT